MVNKIENIDKLNSIISDFENGYALVWFYDDLLVKRIIGGKIANGEINNLEDLVRMRIFNEEKEVHIWRSGNSLGYREKTDDGIPPKLIEETPMVVFGKVANQVKDLDYSLKDDEAPIAIFTKNYIGFNDVGQAGYIDCRFVKFDSIQK